MEFKVQAIKKIEDGKHQGKIVAVEYRNKPYEYVDLVVEFEEGKRVKIGFPAIVTSESKLGKAMIRFGATLQVGEDVSPERIFIGKDCTFMTMNKDTERGTFACVVPESLRSVQ